MNDIPDFLLRKNWTQGMPPQDVNRQLVWSYSLLNNYKSICAHQTFRRYILKDIPYKETPAMKRGNDVHTAFELRIGGGKPFSKEMIDFEPFAAPLADMGAKVEMKLGITKDAKATEFFAQNVWGRGKVDAFVIRDTTAYIVDFKTGKVREDPFELEVGALLLKVKYPEITNIKGQYCWLQENRMGQMHDLSDVAATWQIVCQIMQSIEFDRSNDFFEKRKSGLCSWCDVIDCEFNAKQNNA